MSEQLAEEGSTLGERHNFGPLMFIFKVHYTMSDYFHALYITTVVPCFAVLGMCSLGFAIFLHLGTGMYYVPVVTLLLLATSIVYIHYKRQRRPILLPYKRGLRVYAYQAGLICIQDEHPTVVPWSNITRIHHKPQDSSVLTIWHRNGHKLRFDRNLQNIDILGRLVEREYLLNRQWHTPATINQHPEQKHDTHHQGA